MAENNRGGAGSKGPGLNHGPGSFAHNNADHLPGGPAKAQESAPNLRADFDQNRDPLIARQLADQNKSEAERRQDKIAQVAAFRASRQRHAPEQAPVLRPDLSYAGAVNRGTFLAQQRRERILADPGQVNEGQTAGADAPTKDNPGPANERFRLSRSFAAARSRGLGKTPGRDR